MIAQIAGQPKAVAEPGIVKLHPLVRKAFSVLLIYYWALRYVVTSNDAVERGSFYYYLFVIPVAVFSLILLFGVRRLRMSDSPAMWMAAYMLAVSLVAIARGDFQTMFSTGLFAMTVIVVFLYRLTPSVNFLNGLFLASIAANSLSFLYGSGTYAVLPGFSVDTSLWWRISVFPSVATSAFFSLIVLLMNIVHRDGAFRRICLLLATYFFLLSGLRSALVAGLIIGLYFYLAREGFLRRSTAKITYLVAAITTFIGSLFATELMLLLPDFGSELFNVYFYRSGDGLNSEGDVTKSIYRTWLWTEHFRIIYENPVFGLGTYDFTAIANYDPTIGIGEGGIGSESFLTGLYARVGLPSLLLVGSFISAMLRNAHASKGRSFMIGLMMFVAMFSYGGFMAAYDFVFLVMIGLLSGGTSDKLTNKLLKYPRQSMGAASQTLN